MKEANGTPLDPPSCLRACVLSLQPHSCSSDSNLSNVAEIAVIHLVFTICSLRNSYKRCALIIALFTMGGVIAMEMECLWWFLGVDGTQIPLLDPKMVYVVFREGKIFIHSCS